MSDTWSEKPTQIFICIMLKVPNFDRIMQWVIHGQKNQHKYLMFLLLNCCVWAWRNIPNVFKNFVKLTAIVICWRKFLKHTMYLCLLSFMKYLYNQNANCLGFMVLNATFNNISVISWQKMQIVNMFINYNINNK